MAGGLTSARRWADKLPYQVERALVYVVIDPQPWELRRGSRWPKGGALPWQCAVKRRTASLAEVRVVVCELWYARGGLQSDVLEGLEGVPTGFVGCTPRRRVRGARESSCPCRAHA